MATPPKFMDRRVQRTRQLLQQSFKEVTEEKGFAATSIQDITERANVNRGTFYAHFADKYALLEAIMREEFHELLTSQIPPVAKWDRKTLQLLIQSVLEYMNHIRRQCHLSISNEPWFERATHEELTEILLAWLKLGDSVGLKCQVPIETVAHVLSWAIFGAAACWSQDANSITSEQMATNVLTVVMEGVAHLIPNMLPE